MSRQGRPFIKSAFLIKDPAFEHYFKLHALLTDHSPLQAKLFKEENAAAKWFNVSIESLRPLRPEIGAGMEMAQDRGLIRAEDGTGHAVKVLEAV